MAQNGSKASSLGGVESTHTWDTRSRRLSDTNPYFKSWHVSFLLHSFPLLSRNLTVWINAYLSIKLWFYIYIFLDKKNSTGSCVFGCISFPSLFTNLRVVGSRVTWRTTKGLKALEEDDSFYTTVYSVSAEVLPDAWRFGARWRWLSQHHVKRCPIAWYTLR